MLLTTFRSGHDLFLFFFFFSNLDRYLCQNRRTANVATIVSSKQTKKSDALAVANFQIEMGAGWLAGR
jgi:hypothetical protein